MKLPRYVRNLNGSLYYQRDIPTKLRHLTTTKTFTRPLSLKINEATESAINKALTIASDSFELRLKLITNSDPEAFSATEIDLAVIEFLRKKNLKKGQFRTVIKDPDATAEELRTGGQRQPDESDYADHAIPEFENVKKAALEAGALGSGISGSGPSIFALSRTKETAEKVGKAIASVYQDIEIDFDVHVSKINANGIKVL